MNRKNIIITTIVGSIGIAVLGLSLSLAWYNTSENLYVDTVVINVLGEENITISNSGLEGTFTDSLKFRQNEDKNTLVDAGLFTPVSSMFKSNWLEDDLKTEPEMYFYTNSAVNINKAPTPDVAEWGYYHQHLWLYSTSNVVVTISMDENEFELSEIESTNRVYAEKLYAQLHVRQEYEEKHPGWTKEQVIEDIMEGLANMKKCMRLGLFDISNRNFFIFDPYKDGDTLLGGRADLFLNRYYDSYRDIDDHEYYETIFGEVKNRDKAIYLDASDTDSPEPETYTSFSSRTKADVHAFDLESSLANGLEIAVEDSLSVEDVEKDLYIPLKGGEPKEIVLMAYMEGWDKDCTNQHMGSTFNLDMKFKISEYRTNH